MAQRILDPAYLEAFRDELVNRLNFVTELTQRMVPGQDLGVEPGFGLLDAASDAKDAYARAHEMTWENLQKLRQDLYGAVVTINDALGLHMEAEELNVQALDMTGTDIES